MSTEEELAVQAIDGIVRQASKQHYVTLHELLERHSVQWLVDTYRNRYPNVMAISIPSLLSTYPEIRPEQDPIDMRGNSWERIERSLQRTISDYLR